MFINTDESADSLGVERRKYLGTSNQEIKTSFAVYNYGTTGCVSVPINSVKRVVKKDSRTYIIYEGKLRVNIPLPIEFKPTAEDDLYSELFEGDITWAENSLIPQGRLEDRLWYKMEMSSEKKTISLNEFKELMLFMNEYLGPFATETPNILDSEVCENWGGRFKIDWTDHFKHINKYLDLTTATES